jgi:hypothetical protein
MNLKSFALLIFLCFSFSTTSLAQTTKTWTRWWWMGSAVDKEGIKFHLEEFHRAGLGGVEIQPIYGVKGQEDKFLDFLSPEYLEMLNYTVKIADSLGMGVDMTLGTGWPYGGPQVEPEFAATKIEFDTIRAEKGQKIHHRFENKNPSAKLHSVLAYGNTGFFDDLTALVKNNTLDWVAAEDVTLYGIFEGKTAQLVKRAAPGGDGFTLDHYSRAALEDYLLPFQENLKAPIRAIFNDSFEVYGTDFTPDFFAQFEKRRGYDVKRFLPILLKKEDSELANRIRSDYRETIGELLKEEFNQPWTQWANTKSYITRLQAHGSPGNLLDLYASADIPEAETFGSMPFDIPGLRREAEDIRAGDADPIMLKFSSSAAHMTGKPLVSSETFTWLRDHFKTALSQTKPELEELFLTGVNHIFLHGSTYSSPEAAWPGWKFYASVNFSPQLNIWKDAPALFRYIENCQTLLQSGQPDNEIALYWPVYDVWAEYMKGDLVFKYNIHDLKIWLHHLPFYATGNELMKKGYSIDFFSDEFLKTAQVENGEIVFTGGSYKAIVIPELDLMPLATLNKLLELKATGGKVIFQSLPKSVPGFLDYEEKTKQLHLLTKNLTDQKDVTQALEQHGVFPESLIASGLKFIKRKLNDGHVYYLVNHTSTDFDGYLPINSLTNSVVLYDPITEISGKALVKADNNKNLVRLQLRAGESVFIRTDQVDSSKSWSYFESIGIPEKLKGPFALSFISGGPILPDPRLLDKLFSWTELGEKEEAFSGTAVYESVFDRPEGDADAWLLKLPDVRESARIWINGEFLGTCWANPFEIRIENLKETGNTIKIEVTNLSSNRIRAMELAGEEWKIFYEINMVDKDYKKFDATAWNPMPSGLIGEIKIQRLVETQ